jgi:hypothetical protein
VGLLLLLLLLKVCRPQRAWLLLLLWVPTSSTCLLLPCR